MLWRKLLVPLTALMLLLTASAGAGAAAASTGSPTGSGAEAAAADYGAPGPYATAVEVGAVTTLYYPRDIATSDRRHPVIVWGNGTFAFPVVYRELLLHWASQGFIVAAANTPQSNLGISMRAGIDLLTRRNADQASPFHDRVDLEHIGASGHSQGGAAAIVVGADPRIDTILPIQPGPLANIDNVHVPALLLAGQKDSIVFPFLVKAFYNDADHIPAIYGELRGADHLTVVGDPGPFAAPTTAWFKAHLMGDQTARAQFFGADCGICTDSGTWSDVRRNGLASQ
ncbi:acetylxylan esterase [Streptomyces sp. NBC_01005]|uniref:Alpha/beta hydrolase family protein n=1 Tax=Streptomyces sanglieri TaxID=193460 RepID=A0ABW2WW00_9ACTN|nr:MULTISPECIES: acetylxylan esterase [unclassified Streptomyces]WSG53934.1 acetylxylan esterase [Streptomyces sp. NBC_01732]WSW04795.1 acetylxylan esterase [Streptomyces sp. NBC_01005]WTC94299.1 acetylxylan esterase [Streptomyces sp. NBC_01650]MCX4735384.1 acetylxylan esterase [Streptomyces sp. NBC_01363]MDV9197526.1 acetylxylan esterase [Streptomyces sp. Wh19]